MDSAGDAVAAWFSVPNQDLFVATLSPFGNLTWSSPMLLEAESTFPSVAVNGPGTEAVVVWDHLQGTTAVVDASIGTNLFAPAPPSNFSGCTLRNEFLTQTDVIHHLTWTASPTTTVVAYVILRNGDFLARIPADQPLEFNDHNRKDRVDTYTITSINAAGIESTVVTVTVGPEPTCNGKR
jgi:hypothetical protein